MTDLFLSYVLAKCIKGFNAQIVLDFAGILLRRFKVNTYKSDRQLPHPSPQIAAVLSGIEHVIV